MSLSCGATNFDTFQTLAAALKTSTYGKLEFTTQKNSVLGVVVVEHGTSGDALMFPKNMLVCRVLYLREQSAVHSQKISTFKSGGRWVIITSSDIIRTLKNAARFLGPILVFSPKDVSTLYIHAEGAMEII